MTVKSVIDIDLNDAAWQRFHENFKKYHEQLTKTPGIWKAANAESAMLVGNFERMTAALMAQSLHFHEARLAQEKEEKHLTLSERLWTSMARTTKSVAGNILGATKALLSWGGVISAVSGLLGFGGLWGIDRLAMGVGNDRRSSQGLGLSIGENKAFNLNFGRFIDTGKFLGDVTEMMTDPSKSGPLWRLGVNPNGSTEGVATALLDKLRNLAAHTPVSQLGQLNGQYGLSLGTDDWLRLHNMPADEYARARAANARDLRSLNINDRTASGWQDFENQLQRAKDQIGKTFIEGLVPLRGPLMQLSDAFVHLLGAFMHSDLVKDGIDGLAHMLEQLAEYLKTDEFKQTVSDFFATIHSAAQRLAEDLPAIADAVHVIAHPGDAVARTADRARAFFAPTGADLKKYPGLSSIMMAREDTHFGLPTGLLETVKALEHSAANAVSPKGALGTFQLMPGTAKQYGVTDPFDPAQSMAGAGKFLSHLESLYGGDTSKVLAAYNWGEGNLNKLLEDAKKTHTDWRARLPRETRQYLMNANPLLSAFGSNVRIEVVAPPGFSVNTSVNGLRH